MTTDAKHTDKPFEIGLWRGSPTQLAHWLGCERACAGLNPEGVPGLVEALEYCIERLEKGGPRGRGNIKGGYTEAVERNARAALDKVRGKETAARCFDPDIKERIIQCVNACVGMEDPEREIPALRGE